MAKFIKNYALEIYTVISMLLMVLAAMMGELSVVQKFGVVFTFLFILHEWEEGHYPGGFFDLISGVVKISLSEETKRATRVPTSIFLLLFSIIPFVFDTYAIFAVALAAFGIFEGLVHTVGIWIYRTKKFYTPGMVTAHIELVTSVLLLVYLAQNHLGAWYDYTFGPFVFLACFVTMQKTLMMMIGIKYSDMLKLIKAQLKKKD